MGCCDFGVGIESTSADVFFRVTVALRRPAQRCQQMSTVRAVARTMNRRRRLVLSTVCLVSSVLVVDPAGADEVNVLRVSPTRVLLSGPDAVHRLLVW